MKISALRFLILTVLFKLALGVLPGHNHYVSRKMTWSDARTYCREHYTDLSSINNQKEEDDNVSLQQDSWIGLYSDDHDTWKWSGGTNASFFSWTKENNAAANTKCVVFSQAGWLKKNCENKFIHLKIQQLVEPPFATITLYLFSRTLTVLHIVV
uniref:C-type lectin domain-containing protein n=1 Tax=Neolamprologus brichardi TaxID=32507 RepID=A0A3Q4GUV9_NEOBR